MCLGLQYLNSCLYELKSNIIDKYFMTAVNASYSHSSSALFVAMHKGAFYSLRKGDNLKVGAYILIYGHWPPSHLTKILVFL
jgi:hypothetical protein